MFRRNIIIQMLPHLASLAATRSIPIDLLLWVLEDIDAALMEDQDNDEEINIDNNEAAAVIHVKKFFNAWKTAVPFIRCLHIEFPDYLHETVEALLEYKICPESLSLRFECSAEESELPCPIPQMPSTITDPIHGNLKNLRLSECKVNGADFVTFLEGCGNCTTIQFENVLIMRETTTDDDDDDDEDEDDLVGWVDVFKALERMPELSKLSLGDLGYFPQNAELQLAPIDGDPGGTWSGKQNVQACLAWLIAGNERK